MSRIESLLPVCVFFAAAALGCTATASDAALGRLDLMIRPDNAVASGRPLQGYFVVRDLERGQTERIEVRSSYETLSKALPEGAYSLEWLPAPPARLSEDPTVWASALGSSTKPQVLSIRAGRVTEVRVQAGVPSDGSEQPQRAEELPSVEILVARAQ